MGTMHGQNRVTREDRRGPPAWVTIAMTALLLASLALIWLASGRDKGPTGEGGTVTPQSDSTPSSQASATPSPSTVATAVPTTLPPTATSPPAGTVPPTPEASPTPTPSSIPTSTPSPTTSASPTPSAVPSERLKEGLTLQEYGDYAAARRIYANLTAEASPAEEAAEASFRLAECYLLDGLNLEAAASFRAHLAANPDGELSSAAYFMLGEALYDLGAWSDAIAAYEAHRDKATSVVSDVALQREAEAHVQLGEPEEAKVAYEAALESSPDVSVKRSVRAALGRLQLAQGDYDGSLSQYAALQALARTPAETSEAELRQAEVLLLAGRSQEAQDHLRAAMEAAPTSSYAYNALTSLLAAGGEVNDYERGLIDFHNAAYWPAIDAFHRYLEASPQHTRPEVHDYLARSYLAVGLPQVALVEWDRLIDGFPESALWGQAWLKQARAHYQMSQIAEARQLLLDFAAEYTSHAQAPEALSLAAGWSERAGDYDTAAKEYVELQLRYPQSERAGDALFRAALDRYRLGESDDAARLLRQITEQYASYRPPATLLWLGKALLATGAVEEAGEAWSSLLQTAPTGYYAQRARALATEAGLRLESHESDAEPRNQGDDQPAAEEWLRSWLNAPSAGDLSALPLGITTDPAFHRGKALLSLGLRPEGLAALEAVYNRWRDDAQAMYSLALGLRDLSAHRLSILAASRLLDLAPLQRREAAPRFLLELAFPTYFDGLVETEAESQDLDPYLLYAIIRQESLFETAARSYAAAQGLMQIVPATAEWIALQLNWVGFRPEQIYHPYVNVKFGAYYIAFALRDGGGNVITALAGYNAGPGNARRWRALAGTDDDLFVESMTDPQPQAYVRLVLDHYALYQHIYGNGSQ